MKHLFIAVIFFASHSAGAISLDDLSLPPGFKIDYFAEDVASARQMALSDKGIVYVGSMNAGNVYALQDKDNDGKAEKRWIIAKGLKRPSGIAFKDGDLYVADINRILKFSQIDDHLEQPKSTVFFSDLPEDSQHGWKFLRFAPNGELIIPVGAPCNICEAPSDKHARLFSLNMETKKLTELAQGVRNSVGFDFHPSSGELWFSDNGADMLGDDVPADEINRLTKPGSHFGFPYFHEGTVADAHFSEGKKSEDYVQPALKLGAHVAPLGIHFYLGKQFPIAYQEQLFVAEHGSWNRSKKSGYKIGLVTLKDSAVVKYEPFITGFMQGEKTLGRPAAIMELRDGSLLIADDFANVIYRVTYGD